MIDKIDEKLGILKRKRETWLTEGKELEAKMASVRKRMHEINELLFRADSQIEILEVLKQE